MALQEFFVVVKHLAFVSSLYFGIGSTDVMINGFLPQHHKSFTHLCSTNCTTAGSKIHPDHESKLSKPNPFQVDI